MKIGTLRRKHIEEVLRGDFGGEESNLTKEQLNEYKPLLLRTPFEDYCRAYVADHPDALRALSDLADHMLASFRAWHISDHHAARWLFGYQLLRPRDADWTERILDQDVKEAAGRPRGRDVAKLVRERFQALFAAAERMEADGGSVYDSIPTSQSPTIIVYQREALDEYRSIPCEDFFIVLIKEGYPWDKEPDAPVSIRGVPFDWRWVRARLRSRRPIQWDDYRQEEWRALVESLESAVDVDKALLLAYLKDFQPLHPPHEAVARDRNMRRIKELVDDLCSCFSEGRSSGSSDSSRIELPGGWECSGDDAILAKAIAGELERLKRLSRLDDILLEQVAQACSSGATRKPVFRASDLMASLKILNAHTLASFAFTHQLLAYLPKGPRKRYFETRRSLLDAKGQVDSEQPAEIAEINARLCRWAEQGAVYSLLDLSARADIAEGLGLFRKIAPLADLP